MTNAFLTTGKYERDGVNDTSLQHLEGILNYIYHIRERQIDLAIEAEQHKEKQRKLHDDREEQKKKDPSSIRQIYSRLVFFKHFLDPGKPLILCEGPSDTTYLKSAIRKLAGKHPRLASTKDGKLSLDVNFFKYSKQSRDLLLLGGGSTDLKKFLEKWKENLTKFKHHPMRHPIIVLTDNDDGAKQIYSLLNSKKLRINIGYPTTDLFYHISGPLYLIKTQINGENHQFYTSKNVAVLAAN
jgi:hypothetical protein